MNEIYLLLKVMTKEELVEVAKKFSIPVSGFSTLNLKIAPYNILLESIRKELQKGLSFKRKGSKKFTQFSEVCEYLSNKNFIDKEEIKIEDLAYRVQVDKDYTAAVFLSTLIVKFPEYFNEHAQTIQKNINEKLFLLSGLFEEISIDEKIHQLVKETITSIDSYHALLEAEHRIIQTSEKKYKEIKDSLEEKGDAGLLSLYSAENKLDILVPFLLLEKRHQKTQWAPLLALFFYYTLNNQDEDLNNLTSVNEELKNKLNTFSKMADRDKENFEKLFKKNSLLYDELNQYNEREEQLNNKIETIQKKVADLKPTENFFEKLMMVNNVLFITDEKELLTNVLFGRNSIQTTELSELIKINDAKSISNKTIFITRVSYQSTRIWREHTSFLRKCCIPFYELSGYEIEGFIEEMIGFLLTRERSITW